MVAIAPPIDVATIASVLLILDVPHPLATLLSALLFPPVTHRRDLRRVLTLLDEMTVPALKLPLLLVPSLDPRTAALVPERKHHRQHLMTLSLAHLDHPGLLPVVPLPYEHRPQAREMVADMAVSLLGQ